MARKHKKDDKVKKGRKAHPPIPPEIAPTADAPTLVTRNGSFDLEDPELPDWIQSTALKSGGFPYPDNLHEKEYDEQLELLQIELVKLQADVTATGKRILVIFEGSDGAGKGGAILAIREYMNPRTARIVALPKPTEVERGQWYFQRYVAEFPTKGEIVLFDRSWYNRAGVEPVMGFCTPAESERFLRDVPPFEKLLVDDGILLFKFWLNIGREMQLKRFHERRHNPLKIWKLSPIDYAALSKWDDYIAARDTMLKATNRPATPWTVLLANDKRRARLAILRHLLGAIDYRGKSAKVIGRNDAKIIDGPRLLRA